MTYEFGKLSKDKKQVTKIIYRGESYQNTSFGPNATDKEYLFVGLLPIYNKSVPYDKETQHRENSFKIYSDHIDRVYKIIDFTIEELKEKALQEIKNEYKDFTNSRPRVNLILDNGNSIEIDGSRNDKDNFKEKFDLMKKMDSLSDNIKDADNCIHEATINDIQKAYENIAFNNNEVLLKKWRIEKEIKEAKTAKQVKKINCNLKENK